MKKTPESRVLIALGKAIRTRRIEIGLSQEAFAQKAKIHRTYVGSDERGTRNIALINLIRISKALELTPQELLQQIADELPDGIF